MLPSKTRAPQRIAKLLARAGIASRREIERMIEERRIALNGQPIETPATLLTSLHGITVDGKPVKAPAPARLFLYHKPVGQLVTEFDPKGRATIYDKLPDDLPRLMPVGRLDYNTEGLLLMTTDGELKRELELPSSGVERVYRARAMGNVTQDQLEALIEGVEIDGIRYGSIDANMERRTGANVWIEVRITEGKNREVRRVLEHLGLQVNRLIRLAYGPFILGDLPVGEIGEVRQHDLIEFRKGMKPAARAAAPDRAVRSTPAGARTTTQRNTPRATGRKPSGEGEVARGERTVAGADPSRRNRTDPARPGRADAGRGEATRRAPTGDGTRPKARVPRQDSRETLAGDSRPAARKPERPPRADARKESADDTRRPARGKPAKGASPAASASRTDNRRTGRADGEAPDRRPWRGDSADGARPRRSTGGKTDSPPSDRPRSGRNGAPKVSADRPQGKTDTRSTDRSRTPRSDRTGSAPDRPRGKPGGSGPARPPRKPGGRGPRA